MTVNLPQNDKLDCYELELFRLGRVRVSQGALGEGWLVQKRKRSGRWMTVSTCQTQCQVLRWWIVLTGDNGEQVFRLPERFRMRSTV